MKKTKTITSLLFAVPLVRWMYGRYTFWKSSRRHFRHFVGKPAHDVFNEIHKTNFWGADETVSGSGSRMETTAQIRRELPALIDTYGIKSILDIPCGDFAWMKHVEMGGVEYIGADIVADLVATNQKLYGSSTKTFKVLNLLEDPLPKVDLIFCRDCLIHFSNEDVWKALRNLSRSGSKYLLTTNYSEYAYNKEMVTGDFRRLNLLKPPFRLPAPMAFVSEAGDQKDASRGMGLWRIDDLAQIMDTTKEYTRSSSESVERQG